MLRWFSIFDALWCNTKRHYSVFKWHPNATYVPWGTNTKIFIRQDRIRTNDIIFFHSAGMAGYNLRKGTDLLVKAFSRVRGPVKLIIHSQVPLQNYGEDISSLIQNDNRISFISETVPIPGLYHLGDVYVYPTRLEGIGLSIIEALSCGLPVITTETAPCDEFVTNDFNGWLVPIERTSYRKDKYYWPETECDIQKLIEIMEYCVDNQHYLFLWRNNAEAYAKEALDWEKNSKILFEQVNRIISVPTRKISPFIKWDIRNFYSSRPSQVWRFYCKWARRAHFID
jgi:1,2-diacylglycerol 3-alpha-glucosyltransferase